MQHVFRIPPVCETDNDIIGTAQDNGFAHDPTGTTFSTELEVWSAIQIDIRLLDEPAHHARKSLEFQPTRSRRYPTRTLIPAELEDDSEELLMPRDRGRVAFI